MGYSLNVHAGTGSVAVMEVAMNQETKQSQTAPAPNEQKSAKPRRPSHEKVVEEIDKWANSPGLQPPK
jgi:hypothetical protein